MTGAFVFKPIIPKALKDKQMRLQLLSMAHEIERYMLKQFEKTTATWEDSVKFDHKVSLVGGVSATVSTNDELYKLVNGGADPHVIYPKKPGGYLYFRKGYKRKSRPGYVASYKGGKFGPTVRRTSVYHPGFEARNFDKAVQKKADKEFKKIARKYFKRMAEVSGHALR